MSFTLNIIQFPIRAAQTPMRNYPKALCFRYFISPVPFYALQKHPWNRTSIYQLQENASCSQKVNMFDDRSVIEWKKHKRQNAVQYWTLYKVFLVQVCQNDNRGISVALLLSCCAPYLEEMLQNEANKLLWWVWCICAAALISSQISVLCSVEHCINVCSYAAATIVMMSHM